MESMECYTFDLLEPIFDPHHFNSLELNTDVISKYLEEQDNLDSECDSFCGSDEDKTPIQPIAFFKFPEEMVTDIKHVIFNLLADNYLNPNEKSLIQPFELKKNECGMSGRGFRFVEEMRPENRLPELYSQYIKRVRLDLEDPKCIFTQDLYRCYLRASLELLSKYFRKLDKWTYLFHDDRPLFVPGLTIEEAQERVKNQKTIARTKKRKIEDDE
eukprot:TRINITY_DN4276_c0_g1_i1.p1 TRINITY_DN4276_c0_g1~~TRINITY_DN4276_c0_g1_i1.p1  ORF type:complete len:241 (+),score=52.86 TRINITY_DN4276_c0_g1_i1:80-724(+)